MAHVDALSRAVNDETGDVESVDKVLSERLEVCVALTKEERVRFMQQADEHTRKLIAVLENRNKLTKQELSEIENFELTSGILYRLYEGRPLLVVPKSMRKGIVIEAHDYGGHFSVERTVARITANFWFSQLRRYVRQHVKMCLDSLVHKRPAGMQVCNQDCYIQYRRVSAHSKSCMSTTWDPLKLRRRTTNTCWC